MNVDDLQPPHCDQDILHEPGSCRFCDEKPEWQALRQLWGICFTGQEPEIVTHGNHHYQMIACPSDIRRLGGVADRWPGNKAHPHDD